MQSQDLKQYFPIPWAYAPDEDTINDIPQKYGQRGRASLEKGFPLENMTPLAEGGIPPYGSDTNGILKMITQGIRNYEAGKLFSWSQDHANAIGGYPSGAIVIDPNNARNLMISLADNNNDNPAQNTGTWQSIFDITKALKDYLPLTGGTLTGDTDLSSDSNNSSNESVNIGKFFRWLLPKRNCSAWSNLEEHVGVRTSLVFGVGNESESNLLRFDTKGELDVNGDYFAKRKEVDQERQDRINTDSSLNAGIQYLNENKADNTALNTEIQNRINGDNLLLPKAGGEITGIINRQGGGVLPEVMMNPTGRVVMQVFQVTGNSMGQEIMITFPMPFSAPPSLFFNVNRESTADGADKAYARVVAISNTADNTNIPSITNTEVKVRIMVFERDWSIRSHTIWVTAIGVMN